MNGPIGKSGKRSSRLGLAVFIGVAVLVLLVSRSDTTQAQSATGDFGPSRLPPLPQEQVISASPARQVQSPALDKGLPLSTTEGWRTYPIYGGEMTSIAISPVETQTVYVGTRDAGVFKTTDGGQSWQPARDGLTFYPIRALEVDPQHPNTLYAGTDYDGIWKSTDGGATWADSSVGLDKSLIVFNVVLNPQNTNVLYAGTAGGPGLYIGHIYKSENGGATWALQDTGIPVEAGTYINGVLALAVDPGAPLTLYAGTNYRGAFRSMNGGATWAAINDGLPFLPGPSGYRQPVNAMAVDPLHGNRLSAIIAGDYYVFESDKWQQVKQGTSPTNSSLFADYLYFHPTDPSTIYSAGDRFTISTDAGVTWTQRLGWPTSGEVPGVAFHPSTPDTIYAATNGLFDHVGGVYKSGDQGKTWSEASQGITAATIQSVAIDPQSSDKIYAGTGDPGLFYRSQDGGATWSRGYYTINPPPYQEKVYHFGAISDVAVDPLNSQKIYIAATRFYTSTDYGEIFRVVDAVEYPTCIAISPQASSPIYVATKSKGIYRSSDAGQTWNQKNQGLPAPQSCAGLCPIVSLAIDPSQSETVWAGTKNGGGIVKTIDGAEHWQVKGAFGMKAIESIAVHPQDGNTILAGVNLLGDGNLYKSTDGGSTWQLKLTGVAPVKQIVFDPRDPRWVYAATEGYGVLRSFNGGDTWFDYSTGIFYPVMYSLAISQDDPPLLIAGSYGSGLYWTHPAAAKGMFLPMVFK